MEKKYLLFRKWKINFTNYGLGIFFNVLTLALALAKAILCI